MPPTDLFIAFLLAAAVFAYIPGPSVLYAASQTLALGTRAGWNAALGIHMGGYVHVFAAAFGLAILFTTVPVLYTTLKLLGAAYLVFLGARMVLTAAPTSDAPPVQDAPNRAFWNSAMVEVLNPKTALFYLAFLPQFTDPAAALPIWAQLLILGTLVNLMFSSADVICVLLAGRITLALRRSSAAARWTRRLGGGVLVALGANLALTRH